MSFSETLLAHLSAKTPVMIVPTAEPTRALNDIISVCRTARNSEGAFLAGNVKRWTYSEGLVSVMSTINQPTRRDDGNKDPITALENILSEDINISHMYVMVNYHHFINSPMAQQLLLDAVDRLPMLAAAVSKRIILLMPPGAAIPPALDRQVMRLQYGLPEAADLMKPLEVAVNDRRRRGRPVTCADPDHLRKVAEGGVGLSLTEFENVIVRSLAQHGGFDVKQISDEKADIVRKSGILEFIEVTKTLDDIGGLEHMKQWLLERSRCFSEEAASYGLPPPKGVMMVGVSGGGKSLSAEACASVFGVPLIRLDMGKVFGSLVGQSEGNIQTVIQTLGAVAPVVLWIN